MAAEKEMSPTARMRSEKAEQQARDRELITAENEASAKALDERTVRLRAMRLERDRKEADEAAQAAALAKKAAASKKKASAKKAAPAKKVASGKKVAPAKTKATPST